MKRTGIKNREKEDKVATKVSKNTLLFALLVIVGIIGIIIVVLYVNDETSMIVPEETYQYLLDTPNTYNSGTKISSEYMEIIDGNSTYAIDHTPFYSTSSKRFYIPRNYSWHDVLNNRSFRIPEFTKVDLTSDYNVEFTIDNTAVRVANGFMFDDSNNFIFFDGGRIIVDRKAYEISQFSFYSQDSGVTRIYNYAGDEIYYFDEMVSNVIYTSNIGYSIVLNKGMYIDTSGYQYLLVSSPMAAQPIEERSN